MTLPPSALPALATLVNSSCLLGVMLVIAWPLLRVDAAELFVDEPESALPSAAPPQARQAPGPDPADVAALEHLMRVEQVYREESLTIGALAARLGQPEYKLRRLINQGPGHRNLNTFLNRYRLDEAQAALADPARRNLPVPTIAMDAGFQSLGPFHRAFKAETGLTPTEYRRLRDRPDAPKSAQLLADSEIG